MPKRLIAALLTSAALLASVASAQAVAEAPAAKPPAQVAAPLPDTVVPGLLPITFDGVPTLRTSFKRDEPFIEGDLHYGYTGTIKADVVFSTTFGHRVIAPSGSPAYGVPMQLGTEGPPHITWCALVHDAAKARWNGACLSGVFANLADRPIFLQTALWMDTNAPPYTGGGIEPGPINLGAPVHFRCYVQNLGQIPRFKCQAGVGSDAPNTWGEQWGTILEKYDGGPTVMAIAGGMFSLEPDPAAKDHYLAKTLVPFRPGAEATWRRFRLNAKP